MFAAVDPIPMVQLINLLDNDYVVWDKSAEIRFKRPASETLYATFSFDSDELRSIKDQVAEKKEIEIVKRTALTNKSGDKEFCIVLKTIYIADKAYYKQKRALKKQT